MRDGELVSDSRPTTGAAPAGMGVDGAALPSGEDS
jgi:hypothetical protein